MKAIPLSRFTRHTTTLRDGAIAFATWKPLAPAVAFAVEALPVKAPNSILLLRDPLAPVHMAARRLYPEAAICRFEADAWAASLARENFEAELGAIPTTVCDVTAAEAGLPSVTLEAGKDQAVIAADPPRGPFDLAVLVLPVDFDLLFARELVEAGHDALAPGGRLLVSVDGAPGRLQKIVKEVFGKVDLGPQKRKKAAVLFAKRGKDADRAQRREHESTLDRGAHTVHLVSRPGVFAHARLDLGTKALLKSFAAAPEQRVLDLGCGTGALGLAAAADRGSGEGVVLVDASARAVACAAASARRSGFDGVQVLLRADLEDLPEGGFDLVLANPPYFANGRIAGAFAATASRVLRPGGRMLMVAKARDLHEEIVNDLFEQVTVHEVGEYHVFEAAKPVGGGIDA